MSVDFKWVVESKDDSTRTMVVEYSLVDGTNTHRLNIPQPQVGSDLTEHVTKYAPASWLTSQLEYDHVEEGSSGVSTLHPKKEAEVTESPNVVGDWGEEYLRAMIYQVLEEIKDAQV